jgi:acetyl-CoA C-acetyltransferase
MSSIRRVAILGGNRIPFARSNTAYARATNQEMLTAAIQGLADRTQLHGQRLGDVAGGAVMKHSRDFNLVRETVLSTTLAPETPAFDLQQACGTGLEAIMVVANKIALGHIESGIGCGVDTTSDAPIGINERMRKVLLEANRAKTTMQRLSAMAKLRPDMLVKPAIPKNAEPRTGYSMGEHGELMAQQWRIPREEQDQLALKSHQRLARAYHEGFFTDLVSPFKGLSQDNTLRPELTIEKLRSLKPCFDKKVAPGQGTLTPGNSTPLTDGASAVLLGSDAWAKERGLPVLAYLTFTEVAAVDFFKKKEGLLMAPAYAVPRMLRRAGLTLQDFDFYEIHEAFAGQVLCTLKAWEDADYCQERLGLDAPLGSIEQSKLNVNGSSIAAGHPFAATGGRVTATLAKLLAQKGSGRGLISICAAGGQGVTAILEAP